LTERSRGAIWSGVRGDVKLLCFLDAPRGNVNDSQVIEPMSEAAVNRL